MFKHIIRRYLSLALVLVLVLAASVGTVQTAVASGDNGLEKAIAAQEAHTDALLSISGVNGTAVGFDARGVAIVLVLTEEPGVSGIPNSLDGVPVRPKFIGVVTALHHRPGHGGGGGGGGGDPVDPTARFDRPVPIGVSTGHPDITAGTIGVRVTDGTNVYALSNNHVYADENQVSLGDAVIQPGTADDGSSPADDIGTLYDFQTIVFSDSASNVIDAAIALSSTAELGNATPSDGYGTPKTVTRAARVNQKVMKYGRTTGQTNGRVTAINATVIIGYSSGVARFINQIIIEPGGFSAGGDSGSLIVSNERGSHKKKPVGLLYAGSFFVTIANPIDAVLTRFGVTIDSQ